MPRPRSLPRPHVYFLAHTTTQEQIRKKNYNQLQIRNLGDTRARGQKFIAIQLQG